MKTLLQSVSVLANDKKIAMPVWPLSLPPTISALKILKTTKICNNIVSAKKGYVQAINEASRIKSGENL